MWRLESLHKLQKSLDETVEAVSSAKSKLLAQIYDKVRMNTPPYSCFTGHSLS